MQVPAPQGPLRALGPLRAEPEPAGILVVLEQLATQETRGVLGERNVELVELAPPGELVISEQRPAVRQLVGHPQAELRGILDRGVDLVRFVHTRCGAYK